MSATPASGLPPYWVAALGIGLMGPIIAAMWMLKQKGPNMTKLEKAALDLVTILAEKCAAYEKSIESFGAQSSADLKKAQDAEARERTSSEVAESLRTEVDAANDEIERLREELAIALGKRNARASGARSSRPATGEKR